MKEQDLPAGYYVRIRTDVKSLKLRSKSKFRMKPCKVSSKYLLSELFRYVTVRWAEMSVLPIHGSVSTLYNC